MNKTIHQLNDLEQLKDTDEFILWDSEAGNSKKYAVSSMRIPVGVIMPFWGLVPPSTNWLVCDGRDTTGTAEELAIVHPKLYEVLGNSNILPDLQECTIVGIGHNRTNIFNSSERNPTTQQLGTQTHDEYNLGEFKDDQSQKMEGTFWAATGADYISASGVFNRNNSADTSNRIGRDGGSVTTSQYKLDSSLTTRTGAVTHGRQVGLNFIIRAD